MNVNELKSYVLNNKVIISITAVVALLAFAVRLTPYFKYSHYGIWLQYDDSMFEYWLSKTLYSKGIGYWYDLKPENTRWLWWWPEGRDIRATEYPGLSFTGALLYHVAKLFGLRLVDWVGIEPAFFGFLATIAAALLGYILFGPVGSLVFAISVGFQHAFMNRSIASFVEKMAPSLTFVTLSFAALTWFLKKKETDLSSAVLSGALIGLNLMLGYAFWGGTIIGEGIIVLTMLFLPFFYYHGEQIKNVIVALAVALIVFVFSSLWITTLWMTHLKYVSIDLLVLALIVLIVEYFGIKTLGSKFKRIWTYLLLVIFIFFPLSAGFLFGLLKALMPGRYILMLFPWLFKATSALERSIAEHQRIFATYPAYQIPSLFGVGVLAPLALYVLWLYYKEFGKVEIARGMLPVTLGGLFATYLLVSNTASYLVTVLGFLSALGGATTLAFLPSLENRKTNVVNTTIIAAISLLAALLILLSMVNAIKFALNYPPPSYLSAGTALYTPLFPESMTVLHRQCKYVVAWWDYGYMIGTVANDTTVVDPGTLEGYKIKAVAMALTGNGKDLMNIMKRFDLPANKTCIFEYEIFPVTKKNNENIVVLYPQVGDFAKSIWMLRIAGYSDKEIFEKYIKMKVILTLLLPDGKLTQIVTNDIPKIEKTTEGVLIKLKNGKTILAKEIAGIKMIPLYDVRDVLLYAMMYKALKENGFNVIDALGQPIDVNINFKHLKLIDLVSAKLYYPNTNTSLPNVLGFVAIYRYIG